MMCGMLAPNWTRGTMPAAMDVTGASTSLMPVPCQWTDDTARLTVAGGRIRPSSSQANGEATDEVLSRALRLGAVPRVPPLVPLLVPLPERVCAVTGAEAASASRALAAIKVWRVIG